jgi:MoxR-like ATPase
MIEPTRPGAGFELIGRDAETERIDAVIDALPERGGALVLSGEAGIGKSALLAHAAARAETTGARVLETVGVEPWPSPTKTAAGLW